MSVEIWPHVPRDQLKVAVETAQVWRATHHRGFRSQHMALEMELDSSWVLIEPYFAPPKQKRELDWLVQELRETLTNLKHGLEDCYALLAPIDPGCTLVLSTLRNEVVKGTVTRVGTRIVKGVCCHPPRPVNPTSLHAACS
ncbi:hypothetical protein BT67DRAFT_442987 [Trichocladium antarcticum]|uniref:Uncharacterized protein n=1 Tax=Trichocladium antarcticum TaxID=1450529 RepID=A0AAN6ZDL5_9PEZI|nr:hypothetical protein BT67DRAFT_442987 [Trichocladium antarcticum]